MIRCYAPGRGQYVFLILDDTCIEYKLRNYCGRNIETDKNSNFTLQNYGLILKQNFVNVLPMLKLPMDWANKFLGVNGEHSSTKFILKSLMKYS